MPIKFRCEHCQQLLGISRSRAAATVDCPQCGRSLRVPGSASDDSQNDVRSPQTTNSEIPDADLMSALNELTMLGQADDNLESASHASTPSTPSTARPFDDSSMVIQGKDLPQERARQRDIEARSASSNHAEASSLTGRETPSMDSMEALQDLATWAAPEPALPSNVPPKIATDLLSEMRQVSHPSSWLGNSIAALLLIVISGAAGWWLAKSEQLEVWLDSGGIQNHPLEKNEDEQADIAAVHIPAAIRVDPAAWVISVTGQVQYVDEAGLNLPDGTASVYLLPSERQGNLKVHARSFQREPSNADRKFSEAALHALGGLRVEADDEGRFQIGTQTKADDYQLVVVSRHRQRPQNMLPDGSITNALMPWFDSTVHILGQRDAVMKVLSGSVDDLVVTVGE